MSEQASNRKPCPKCGSLRVHKLGKVPTVIEGRKQRFRCYDCGHTFY